MSRPGFCEPRGVNLWLRDKKQQIESQAKRIRSLVNETLAIPPQTGLGLYLHRKGPNQYKLLMSFVPINPFKLTRRDGSH